MTIQSADTISFVNYWIEEVTAGEKYMKKFSTLDKWKDWRSRYRGDWGKEIVPVNRMFSYGRSIIPRVYFNSPRVSITATRPEFIGHAMVVEAVDNWLIQELNLKKTIKRAALQAYISGTAPIKIGFDSEFGFLPDQVIDTDSSTLTQVSQKEDRHIEYNINVKPGLPWALSCMPEDVIVPWGYKDPDTLPWIAHRLLRPLDDVKQDQKYKNTKDLKGSRRASTEAVIKSPYNVDKDIQYCELIEIRDARTRSIIVICEDTLLMKDEDALQIVGLPWEFLTFNEDPEYFWGIPDCYIIEPQQMELNDVKTQQSQHRKISLLKFLYQKSAITETEMEKFLSGDVGPAVGIDAENIATAIITLQPHMPSELWQEAQQILSDMRESVGFSENQVGGFSRQQNKTATETAEVAQGADNRIDEKRDIAQDILLNIVKKWNSIIFSLWDSKRVIEICGPRGATEWVEFSGTELAGEYRLKVDMDSGFPITSNVKRQLADGLFKTYNGDPMVDQMKLRQYHLDKYENVAPGVMGVLMNPNAMTPEQSNESLLAAARQPSPDGSGSQMGSGASPGSNNGGGQKPKTVEQYASEKEGK